MQTKTYTEKRIKALCKDALENSIKAHDARLWYFFAPANGYGRAGVPDILGYATYEDLNLGFALELKSTGGVPSARQRRELEYLYGAGVYTAVISSPEGVHRAMNDINNFLKRGEIPTCQHWKRATG